MRRCAVPRGRSGGAPLGAAGSPPLRPPLKLPQSGVRGAPPSPSRFNGFPKVFPSGGGTAVEQTSTAGPARGARRRGHVNETTNSTLKELSPTRNQLPEKIHEENSKTQNPHILGVSMKGALTGKKEKEKSADSGRLN